MVSESIGIMSTHNQIRGDIDTTYHRQQRDMFASGLAAAIGVAAYAVWNAIKSHSDFNTGDSYPDLRRIASLTGMSINPVQDAIKKLETFYLLRVIKRPRKNNHYIAMERMDVKVGNKVICTIVVDYIPSKMRERLEKLKGAAKGEIDAADVWAQVTVLPGPGLKLDESSGTLQGKMRADEIPEQLEQPDAVAARQEARRQLKQLADEMRFKSHIPMNNK